MSDKGTEPGSSGDRPANDLRYTVHDDGGTHIERELDGSGRLARGDHTHMHKLHFSVRTVSRPREKLAPVHQPATGSAATQHATAPLIVEPAPDSGADQTPPAPSAARRVLDWMTRRANR